MLALTSDPESSLFKRANCVKMVDTGDAGHALCDLDLADFGLPEQIIAHRQIFFDSFASIR